MTYRSAHATARSASQFVGASVDESVQALSGKVLIDAPGAERCGVLGGPGRSNAVATVLVGGLEVETALGSPKTT